MEGGRDALPDLSKAASQGQGWRGLPQDVRDDLMEQLERDTAEKAVISLVSPLNIATHYETQLEALATEVSKKKTICQASLILTTVHSSLGLEIALASIIS